MPVARIGVLVAYSVCVVLWSEAAPFPVAILFAWTLAEFWQHERERSREAIARRLAVVEKEAAGQLKELELKELADGEAARKAAEEAWQRKLEEKFPTGRRLPPWRPPRSPGGTAIGKAGGGIIDEGIAPDLEGAERALAIAEAAHGIGLDEPTEDA